LKNTDRIKKFQGKIFDWWEKNRRDLPWRRTHNPYYILISEIMLQQTQVSRVLTRYQEFIYIYPTAQSLATAKTSDILKLWKGMGYNRRALYLKKAAEVIVKNYNGVFPDSEKELLLLPGVGKYTARAILVFSFKKDVTMVDTNIRKIITHFFYSDVIQPEKNIAETADRLVPKGKSWEWHQALMDYGAMNASEWRRPERSPELVEGRSRRTGQKKIISFRQSTRFFRGRIMDLVREKDWKEDMLIREMIQTYEKDKPFYQKSIEKLIQEGLLSRSPGDIISLPE